MGTSWATGIVYLFVLCATLVESQVDLSLLKIITAFGNVDLEVADIVGRQLFAGNHRFRVFVLRMFSNYNRALLIEKPNGQPTITTVYNESGSKPGTG